MKIKAKIQYLSPFYIHSRLGHDRHNPEALVINMLERGQANTSFDKGGFDRDSSWNYLVRAGATATFYGDIDLINEVDPGWTRPEFPECAVTDVEIEGLELPGLPKGFKFATLEVAKAALDHLESVARVWQRNHQDAPSFRMEIASL